MLNARTTISMPAAILKVADRRARKERRTRSAIFQEAYRQYEQRIKSLEDLYLYGEQKAKEQGVKSEEDIVRIVREIRRDKISKHV